MQEIAKELSYNEALKMARDAGVDLELHSALHKAIDRSKAREEISAHVKWLLENEKLYCNKYDYNWNNFIRGLGVGYRRLIDRDCLVWNLRTYHPITLIIYRTGWDLQRKCSVVKKTSFYKDAVWSDNGSWTTPLSLLLAWQRREFESEGVELTMKNEDTMLYEFGGLKVEVPPCFYEWFVKLGPKAFDKLKVTGIMDSITFKLIEKKLAKIKALEGVAQGTGLEEILKIPKRDRDILKLIYKVKGELNLSQWGEALKKTKSGTLYVFRRLEKHGLLKVEKGANGFKATLTDKGRRAIATLD